MLKPLLALLLFAPFVFAASCPSYPYHDYFWDYQYRSPTSPPDTFLQQCNSLNLTDQSVCNLTNLSSQDKKQLISDAMVRNNGFPDFQTARIWNNQIQFTNYRPDNTNVSSTGSIKDAWIKIISLSPSVLDNNSKQLWVDVLGEQYAQYGFSFVVPKQTFSGDCRTDYQICGYDYTLENKLNGNPIGNSKKSNFTTNGVYNSSQLFSSKLKVTSEYLINHYHTVRHCNRFGCWSTCDFYKTDDKKSTVEVQDTKQAYQYNFIDFPNAIIDEFTNYSVVGWLFVASNDDYNNIRFLIGDSEIKLQSREYKFKIENSPYNSLQVETSIKPYQFYVRNIGILENQNGSLSGQEFEDYLKHGEPVLYHTLHDILRINISAIPIQFKFNKIKFTAPSNSTNCTLQVYSHFENETYLEFCKNPNQSPAINLTITNYSRTNFTAKIVFYDKLNNTSLAGKKITVVYGNETRTIETDANGIVFLSFNRSNSNLVTANFFTDFETKSAHAETYVPFSLDFDLDTVMYLVGLFLSLYLFYKFLKGVYK